MKILKSSMLPGTLNQIRVRGLTTIQQVMDYRAELIDHFEAKGDEYALNIMRDADAFKLHELAFPDEKPKPRPKAEASIPQPIPDLPIAGHQPFSEFLHKRGVKPDLEAVRNTIESIAQQAEASGNASLAKGYRSLSAPMLTVRLNNLAAKG